ncbi:N,N-dimethylformamidase beta subunit family domain-containing protein [Sphaerisporangium fuscum]|uniref:N,N-dimethylformamidase beta subunit family domain-containing protein n=1 Tax=Sphaerisporangium fuscum TaxID=2835868 RepID=UPI001BDCA420|nr:N,N-dimethylformamidase beta subunit family domain-containing protein [Sphaerisporangium fuscum]
MIRGYVEQPSPRAGDRLTLRVATDAPAFRVEFYRCGAELVPYGVSQWLPGRNAPPRLPFQDWGEPGDGRAGWPGYPLPAPRRTGVYVAVLVEGDGDGRESSTPDRTTADGREAKALFVVRPARPSAAVLYKIPLLTYHAYNLVDGQEYDPATGRGHWCLYNMPRPEELPPGAPAAVGLHRPGGGTGGTPYDIGNFDPFDPTPRQTFAHWDGRFIGWMERQGYGADYCTDVDLHRYGPELLAPYRLLVSVGHDEYWSDAMRAAVEGHVAGGGAAAFFGGNTCWWRVVFHDEVTFSRTGFWHELGRPENGLTGVSFRNGGERDRDEHPVPVGYRVQNAGHWVYEGTGVRDGELFGEREYLVGYECDGAEFDRQAYRRDGHAVPTGRDGTPEEFVILGVGDARASGWGLGNGAATMGIHTRGGTVFTAATTDWARALTTCPVVRQITRNVLDRLG